MRMVADITFAVLSLLILIAFVIMLNNRADETYINAMIEADIAYRAAIVEPKQCKQTLNVCWQFLNHKLVTVK